jgi:hypothetical protein
MDWGQGGSGCDLYFVLSDLVGDKIGQSERGGQIRHGEIFVFLWPGATFLCV